MPTNPLLRLLAGSIALYQRTLSPDHGPLRSLFPAGVCRFEPTCSEYLRQSIEKQGWRGVLAGLRQLGRCHPFSRV